MTSTPLLIKHSGLTECDSVLLVLEARRLLLPQPPSQRLILPLLLQSPANNWTWSLQSLQRKRSSEISISRE